MDPIMRTKGMIRMIGRTRTDANRTMTKAKLNGKIE